MNANLSIAENLAVRLREIKGIKPMKRYLVVEDDELEAAYMRETLKRNGAMVDVCRSADAAIDRLGREKCSGDCYTRVFLDLSFPTGKQGYDVLRHLKQNMPNTPVTIVTGFCSPQVEQEAQDLYCTIIDKKLPVAEYQKQLERFL
jgi:CheY-like chemotaxis protein